MSSSSDDGVDPVDLASNIGTWVAAGVAIIALVGVVGPYLALQASMSDKNRAMNAVQDQQQKYISRGWRLARALRVFRRIRVPNLAPGYITNEPDTAPLIPPLSAALGRWGFKTRDYLPWNTGWAKISELIESYEVKDGISNRQVDLDVPTTGGTLEVVNSRTALVVNKHWILILGLLGRYGDRVDKGILQRKGIRRNFDGERASIRHFALPRKAKQRESDLHFEWVRKKQTHAMSRMRGSSSRDSASSRSWSDSEPDSDGTVMAVRRSAYGTITLETTPQPTIYGTTGKLQQLGRHKGSWSYLTSVSFVPHIAKEIFEAGVDERRESSSLQTLFWLAHGFLPCGRTAEGRQMVISLEAPDLSLASIGRNIDDILAWPAYSLQESDDVPISIGIAMQCLGIPEPQILQFLPLDPASQAKRVLEKTSHHSYDGTQNPVDESDERSRRWEREIPAQPAGFSIDGPWVRYLNSSQENFCLFRRHDFEKTLRLLLTVDWDSWGFLIWKDKFWISILRRTTSILKINEICDSEFGRALGLASHSRVFDWKQSGKFYPQRLADQLAFDKFLTEYLDTYGLLHLRLSLVVLYILDAQLRENTLKAYANLCNNGETNDPRTQARLKYLESALEEVEAEHRIQKIRHKDDETPYMNKKMAGISDSESVEEVYTHMLIRALDTETLDHFNIVYEPADDLLYRITGYIAPWEQEIFFKHTSIRRELHQMKARMVGGVLEYTYKSRQLKWYSDKTSMLEYSTWQLSPQDVVISGEKESMWIEEKDMVMVAFSPVISLSTMVTTTKTADLPTLATTRDITSTSIYKDIWKRHQEYLQPSKDTPVKFGDVACSPDGKNVAGIITVYEDLKGRGSTRLAIVDGLSQLQVLDLASKNIKSTDKIPGNVEQLSWSIDGTKILLVVAGLEADLAGVDGGRASQGSERISSECSWMPTIEATPTAEAYRTAWVHCVATGVSEQVTPATINIWQARSIGITLHSARYPLQTGAVKHVFGSELPMEWLTTSPSGAFVAFAVGVASDRAILTGDLHILHVSTGKVSQIDTGDINVGAIAWVGDDDLVASGLRDGRDVVFAYEQSTNMIQELWSSEELSVAGEGISQVSGYMDGDVRVAFVQQGWFTPPTLVVASSLGVRPIKAFGSSELQERIRKLGQAQAVKWKAPDGLEIYGYYLHPPTQGPFPTIMHIHGGPVFGWRPRYLGLDMQLQVLLDAGFAVFEPNPRGSWGRGQSFAKAVYGDMGGVDTLDYVSGIDYLVDKGLADPSRLGVYGASYGGFMTAWLITQTDRFKAAIPTSPVTDWVSEHFTSNLARFCQDFLADDVHDFGGKYLSRSPLHHIRKTRTPTMLVCGALDKNTPPGQAVEFHHGLIEQGIPSVLLTYPEEGHGVRNIPARVDLIAREVEWFRRYM
ncbi:hypothetical protein FNAPI_41 [Fusarium napiforme]|uniref:Dipeptidyl-peptidase V n=1 Tax=Fusarium napiforme TaxID=42672 RepID=A0A8H5K9Z8_9HYPO|nr:hypothetical protein FNAPI_41 [Fusarium napiforme]